MKKKNYKKAEVSIPVEDRGFQLPKINFDSSWFYILLIVAAGTLLYFKAFSYNFVDYDEGLMIQRINSPEALLTKAVNSFKMPYLETYYRPVINISLMIDYAAGQMRPLIYHVTNVVTHLINASLLFLILIEFNASRKSSFLLSLFFMVHPLCTQAVVWMPGRNDSILALFTLSGTLMFLKYLKSLNIKYFMLYIVFFSMSLLSKETALIIPFILSIYIWLKREELNAKKTFILFLPVWIVLSIGYLFARNAVLSSMHKDQFSLTWDSFLTNLASIPEIIGKIVLPLKFSPYILVSTEMTLFGYLIIFSVISCLIYFRKKVTRNIIFGILWIFLFILPFLLIPNYKTPNHNSYIESRFYIPLIGLTFLLIHFAELLSSKHKAWAKIILLFLILIPAIISFNYSTVFSNPMNHWSYASAKNSSDGYTKWKLGQDYLKTYRDVNSAEREYLTAVNCEPDNAVYHSELGIAYGLNRKIDLAEKELLRAIELNDKMYDAYASLGFLYFQTEDYDKAEKYWLLSIQKNENFLEPYINLIDLYITQTRDEEAKNLGAVLNSKGQKMDFEQRKTYLKNNR